MEPISPEIVEKTWKKMAQMSSPQETQKMVTLMSKKQPFILAYLMAVGSDIFNQDERELLFYIGMNVWQMMFQGSTPLPKIKGKILDKTEKANMKMIEHLKDKADIEFIDSVEKIINNYSQPELLKYVIEALMEETEEGCQIRDENIGIMAIYLKTVIDCLNT